jgi:hypothetical protein
VVAFGIFQRAPALDDESRQELKGDTVEVDDLKATPLELPAKEMQPCLLWTDKEGSAFLTIDNRGVLRRISFPAFKETQKADFRRKCAWLDRSAEGLVLSVPDPQEVWLLNPDTLKVSRKIAVPGLKRAVSSPKLSVAVASSGSDLYVVDLKKGKATKFAKPLDKPLIGFGDPMMTPDGKYVFAMGGVEALHRYKLTQGRLKFEESSPRIAQGRVVAGIQVSPDSKYVCLPSGGGNYGVNYGTYIYPVANLQKAEFTLEQGAYPEAVGFDAAAGQVYSQNFNNNLIVFSDTGLKEKEYKVPPGGDVRQYLVHPKGYKLLLLASEKLVSIELPHKK